MTIHEAMHAFMGYFLGDQTAKAEGRLSLNPIRAGQDIPVRSIKLKC